ncbi:MAG TPA: GFA family protein [Candidatus Polarisedimenticolia bacterium]|nr:GFA family protein [Candidatus Polarisedimenticolia bacterium]
MAEHALTGRCLCGQVRFEITEPPQFAGYCHCTRCQRRTGTGAAVSARIAPGSLRVLSGEGNIKAFRPPDGFAKVFCTNCGGALWSQSPKDPDVISVRMGAFDSDPGVRPSYRQYVDYAAKWEPIPDDGLPRFAEARKA